MKIIVGMKRIKELLQKAEDLRTKVGTHCANLSIETPVYQDTKAQINGWLQAHSDIMREVLTLRTDIQWTNLHTNVTITLGGENVTKTIAEWIHRRRDLATAQYNMYSVLGDRKLKEALMPQSVGEPIKITVVRHFDPVVRDNKMELYRSEPHIIDASLEVVNATTDLIPLRGTAA